jgi:uracil-DNA glycosylase family 4
MSSDRHRLDVALRQRLESLRLAGVTDLPRVEPVVATAANITAANVSTSPVATPPAATTPFATTPVADATATSPGTTAPPLEGSPQMPRMKREDKIAALAVIQQEVAGCTLCGELASTRTQTVFGVGNPHAKICFLGEAPGADEDRQGEPFVGRAGQLLNRIIEACTLRREDVYILNVLKCRPPGNRNPAPEEAANCWGYLDRQLDIIRPKVICCLGSIAAKTLLDTTQPIGRMRGQFYEYRNIPVACTYHPAYLLRNPSAKRQVWEDMKMVMSHLGVELGDSGK